jgi:SnoaL-like domain
MMHYLHNTHVEIDGDRATGVGYMLVVGVPDRATAGDHFDMGGSYDWEFVRTPEGWRVLKQHLTLTWTLGSDTLAAFVDA